MSLTQRQQQLFAWIKQKEIEPVKALVLADDPNNLLILNNTDQSGQTVLQLAARAQNFELFDFLLNEADLSIETVNSLDNQGRSVLLTAVNVEQPNLEIIVSILNSPLVLNQTLNQADHNGLSPLRLAIRYQDLSVVNLLLDSEGIVPRDSDLTAAVKRGDQKLVARILNNDNFKQHAIFYHDANDISYLIYAVQKNRYELFDLLLSAEPNLKVVNFQDQAGNTALHYAAMLGDQHIVNRLLIGGADPSLINLDGQTAAQVATNVGVRNTIRQALGKSSVSTGRFVAGKIASEIEKRAHRASRLF